MKKCIYNIFGVFFCIVIQMNSAVSAVNKIAIVNIANVFQQYSQRIEIIKQLEYEFKDRAAELEVIEHDLQIKIKKLQQEGPAMEVNERNELEQSLTKQREIFSEKAKEFQQDNHSRQTEERDKILGIIYNVVKNIAKKENYDIVFDVNSVVYHNSHIKDITGNVIKEVK